MPRVRYDGNADPAEMTSVLVTNSGQLELGSDLNITDDELQRLRGRYRLAVLDDDGHVVEESAAAEGTVADLTQFAVPSGKPVGDQQPHKADPTDDEYHAPPPVSAPAAGGGDETAPETPGAPVSNPTSPAKGN